MIDFHTHCYPDHLAEKAMASLPEPTVGTGTRQDLLSSLSQADFSAAVCLNVAVYPRSQAATNRFANSVNSAPLVSFGSIHPDAPDALDALDGLKESGICGVKFHPTQQQFHFSDKKYFPIYRHIGELGLITLVHSGGKVQFPDFICGPGEVAEAIDCFQGAPFVMAHMGGTLLKANELDTLCRLPVYLDTAFCAEATDPAWFMEILSRHGTDRVLLGSDYPWSTPQIAIDYLKKMPLTREELHAIGHGNAVRLLHSVGVAADK